jgi:hypothetical protein
MGLPEVSPLARSAPWAQKEQVPVLLARELPRVWAQKAQPERVAEPEGLAQPQRARVLVPAALALATQAE